MAIPGTAENQQFAHEVLSSLDVLAREIARMFKSEPGEVRDKPPAGSKRIDHTPWSDYHDQIEDAIGAEPLDNVGISPDGQVWGENPDGSWTNHGPATSYTGSGCPSGRRGKERRRRLDGRT